MNSGPLRGLRVIDISAVLAGPNCARYLADFGADVIKVERPDGGDSLRNLAWRDPRDGEGLWWKVVNRNKRTIALDLKSEADLDVLRGLVGDADVLVDITEAEVTASAKDAADNEFDTTWCQIY